MVNCGTTARAREPARAKDRVNTPKAVSESKSIDNDGPNSTLDFSDSTTLATQQYKDNDLRPFIDLLQREILPDSDKVARSLLIKSQDYVMDNGILYHLYAPPGSGHRKDRVIKQIVVPHSLRDKILKAYHDSLLAGHAGIERTFQAIRLKYYWTSMFADIKQYVQTCTDCQVQKRDFHKKAAPLRPLPVPGRLFDRLQCDFIGPFPKTKLGHRYIFLLTCAFSRWTMAFPLLTLDAAEVTQVFYDKFICIFGTPREILTDNGSSFTSRLFTHFCHTLDISTIRVRPYHQQANGACERLNSFIEQTLRFYVHENQDDWDVLLPSIMSAYNTTPASQSTGFSPYFILFGQEYQLPVDIELQPHGSLPQSIKQRLETLLHHVDVTRKVAKENLIRAHDSMKVYYDRKTQTPVFTLGDKVWLDAPAMEVGKSKKLRYLFKGPYYICDELQNFTYQLRRCEDNTLLKSPVHANRLKRFYSPKDRLTNPTRDIPAVTATEQGESDRDVVRESSESEENASDSEVSDETNFNLDDDDVYRVKVSWLIKRLMVPCFTRFTGKITPRGTRRGNQNRISQKN